MPTTNEHSRMRETCANPSRSSNMLDPNSHSTRASGWSYSISTRLRWNRFPAERSLNFQASCNDLRGSSRGDHLEGSREASSYE